MPAIECENGKWKWGHRGQCVYDSKIDAEKAGIAILYDKKNKLNTRIDKELRRYGKK